VRSSRYDTGEGLQIVLTIDAQFRLSPLARIGGVLHENPSLSSYGRQAGPSHNWLFPIGGTHLMMARVMQDALYYLAHSL
jgi:hypothetical protein